MSYVRDYQQSRKNEDENMNLTLVLLIILLTTLIGIICYTILRKILNQKNKKKIIAIITAGSTIMGGGMIYYFSGDVIIDTTGANELWFSASTLNAFFTADDPLALGNITLDSSYTQFNTTVFKITAPDRINITLNYLISDHDAIVHNTRILDFNASINSGTVVFRIGGLEDDVRYLVKRNGINYVTVTANSSGYITFTNAAWSERQFTVYKLLRYQQWIRTYGEDYFTYLGANTTASTVKATLTGLGEATEYIAILSNTGMWTKYYGDGTGTNFQVKTFDVIRTFMDDAVGNFSFNFTGNDDVDYNTRTVSLKKVGNGYNYTSYTNSTNTTLLAINTILSLPRGYFIGLWNRTTFTWNYWISGFGITNKNVPQYSVIMSKINADKTWSM